jgi:hypothetical protein
MFQHSEAAGILRGRLDPDHARGVTVKLIDKHLIEISIPGANDMQLERDQ